MSLLPAVLSLTHRGAGAMGRARSMTGLIGQELKEALPIGSCSLTAAPLSFFVDRYFVLRYTTLH